VLALTAYASLEEERKIRRAGFDAYLAKPIGAGDLAAAIGALARSATQGR
jgi:CheY-like chemotaxis protein